VLDSKKVEDSYSFNISRSGRLSVQINTSTFKGMAICTLNKIEGTIQPDKAESMQISAQTDNKYSEICFARSEI
jgi:uncharacterized protein YdeI (BOF family)